MWLDKRSSSPFYPTPDLQLAYAWIGADEDGGVGIRQPPDFYAVRHAIGFAAEEAYFRGATRDGELDLRRRLLLLDVIPRVLVAKGRKRVFQRTASPEALHAFVMARVSAVAQRIGARLAVLSLPMLPELGRRDGGLAAAARACDCAVVVDGFGALEERGALDARFSHPDVRAHAAYADALARALGGEARARSAGRSLNEKGARAVAGPLRRSLRRPGSVRRAAQEGRGVPVVLVVAGALALADEGGHVELVLFERRQELLRGRGLHGCLGPGGRLRERHGGLLRGSRLGRGRLERRLGGRSDLHRGARRLPRR